MKKLLALAMMPFSAALANPMSSVAQEKFQASAGIELASSYVQLTWNPTTEAAHLIAGICL